MARIVNKVSKTSPKMKNQNTRIRPPVKKPKPRKDDLSDEELKGKVLGTKMNDENIDIIILT